VTNTINLNLNNANIMVTYSQKSENHDGNAAKEGRQHLEQYSERIQVSGLEINGDTPVLAASREMPQNHLQM